MLRFSLLVHIHVHAIMKLAREQCARMFVEV